VNSHHAGRGPITIIPLRRNFAVKQNPVILGFLCLLIATDFKPDGAAHWSDSALRPGSAVCGNACKETFGPTMLEPWLFAAPDDCGDCALAFLGLTTRCFVCGGRTWQGQAMSGKAVQYPAIRAQWLAD
jgi:hypothetical protein